MGRNAKNNNAINNPFKNNFGNNKSNFKSKFSNTNKNAKSARPDFKKQWGKEKFVPRVPNRRRDNHPPPGEEATPWGHFKTELLEKKKEDAHANAVDMNSAEAKEMLKQREQNFRRTIITSQANQPTKWEKFDDDDNEDNNESSSDETTKKGKTAKPQSEKHKNSNYVAKGKKNNNFAGIDLENFDAKKLTFKQNNDMRKALTKGFMSIKDKSLAGAVNDLKRKKQKKTENFQAFKKPDFKSNQKQKSRNPFSS